MEMAIGGLRRHNFFRFSFSLARRRNSSPGGQSGWEFCLGSCPVCPLKHCLHAFCGTSSPCDKQILRLYEDLLTSSIIILIVYINLFLFVLSAIGDWNLLP